MGEKKVVNLSRFLMFEEVEDSEAGFDRETAFEYDQVNADADADVDADAEADAESCCSDQSGDTQIEDEVLYDEIESDEDEDDEDCEESGGNYSRKMRAFWENGFDEEGEEDEVMSEVTSTANSYDSRKCVESRDGSTSEVEKNRLFWEACLGS